MRLPLARIRSISTVNICCHKSKKPRAFPLLAFLFRMTGFEIGGIFGCAAGLRCPKKSSGLRCSLIFSTAAHKTLCFICLRQRRAFWPKARDLLCSQAAAGSKRSMKTQREPPIKGSSLCVVRVFVTDLRKIGRNKPTGCFWEQAI